MGYSINSTLTDKRSKKNLSSSDREVSVKIDSSEGEYINYNLKESYILKGSKADVITNNLGVSVTNNILHHLTLIDPSRLNSVIARAVDGSKFKLEWYHKNYLDHVYAVSDDSGDILEHYRYSAFGEVQIYNASGTQVATTQIDNHILWNTRRRDELTGYYLYKYRHYSSELGRWPARDPIEEKGGMNLYGFVGNDPVGRWDRLGNAEWKKTGNKRIADTDFYIEHYEWPVNENKTENGCCFRYTYMEKGFFMVYKKKYEHEWELSYEGWRETSQGLSGLAGVSGAGALYLGVLPEPTGVSKAGAVILGGVAAVSGTAAGVVSWLTPDDEIDWREDEDWTTTYGESTVLSSDFISKKKISDNPCDQLV